MTISLIAAIDRTGAIGYRNRLLRHIPEDLKRFKALTLGHTVIMGHNTFRSLPHGALPGRRNIVLSKQASDLKDCEIFPSLESALEACSQEDEVFIIGGANVYRQTIRVADKLFITLINEVSSHADAFFPHIDPKDWVKVNEEKHDDFSFISYVSRKKEIRRQND